MTTMTILNPMTPSLIHWGLILTIFDHFMFVIQENPVYHHRHHHHIAGIKWTEWHRMLSMYGGNLWPVIRRRKSCNEINKFL